MKLKGRRPGVNVEIIVLPRGDGEDLVFKAKAVEDFEMFDKLCPPPEPPKRILPGGEQVPNFQDKNYSAALENYGKKRIAFMVIQGLAATEDLEWEQVDVGNHQTWPKYREELRESGLSEVEINRIVNGCMKANSLNEHAVEQARKRFLASQQALREEQSSQTTEQPTSESGEPASASE